MQTNEETLILRVAKISISESIRLGGVGQRCSRRSVHYEIASQLGGLANMLQRNASTNGMKFPI
jgi:hypothetical protein